MQLNEVLLQGLRSAQPAANIVAAGTLYYVTDEFLIEQSDTSAWSAYSGTSGSLAINQLTGDVTAGPGSGSVAAAIASHAVTNAKFRQGAALSVVGVTGNATADVADIAAASDAQVLRRSGTALAFGAVNLAAAAAVTGVLPIGNGGTGLTTGPAIFVASLQLTDAQIKALPTTPVNIVAAPGANLRYKLHGYTLRSNTSAGAYTNLNATYVDVHIQLSTYYAGYGPVDDSTVTPALTNVTSILGAAGQVSYDGIISMSSTPVAGSRGYVQSDGIPGTAVIVNQPIAIAIENNGSGNLTGGNAANSLKVFVYYSIEDMS